MLTDERLRLRDPILDVGALRVSRPAQRKGIARVPGADVHLSKQSEEVGHHVLGTRGLPLANALSNPAEVLDDGSAVTFSTPQPMPL